jgi:hypothetical protein
MVVELFVHVAFFLVINKQRRSFMCGQCIVTDPLWHYLPVSCLLLVFIVAKADVF